MKYCEKCNAKFDTDRKTCPLCFYKLDEINGEENNFVNYPKRTRKIEKYHFTIKLFLLLFLIATIAPIVVNIVTHKENEVWWSIYTTAGMIYLFTLVKGMFLGRAYFIKKLLIQCIAMSITLWIIDLISGNKGWSLAIVIPWLCIATNITNGMFIAINKRSYSEAFTPVFLSLFIGNIPLILQCFKLIKYEPLWSPIVSASVSLLLFLAILIFGGKRTKEELDKRLHI